jgi:hypothetical protein
LKGIRLTRLALPALFILILSACGNDNNTSSCGDSLPQQKISYQSTSDFGDGSDGELYLAHGDVFYLQEQVYNFTNVNLDAGSRLLLSDAAATGSGVIEINSLGACNLYGLIDIAGYQGALSINCSTIVINMDNFTPPAGDTSLNTADANLPGSAGQNAVTLSTSDASTPILVDNGVITVDSSDLAIEVSGVIIQTDPPGPSVTVDISEAQLDCVY